MVIIQSSFKKKDYLQAAKHGGCKDVWETKKTGSSNFEKKSHRDTRERNVFPVSK